MKKRVLITGATGFIGRHCLPFLKNRKYELFALTSKSVPPQSEGITWLNCDLLDSKSIKELVAFVKPTHLLHLAWDVTHGKFWHSQSNLEWLKASIDLVEAFSLHGGQRVVIAGSCAEYDWNASRFCESSTSYKPHTLYGTSKLALRLVAESFCKQMGISMAWGHIFFLYGPHEYPLRLIPSIIKGILKNETISCSHGNQIRDFLHVEDVASAFCALLDSPIEGSVNISSGHGVTLKQMINIIMERLAGEELVQFGVLPAPKNDSAQMIGEIKRLREELNWTPRYSLDEGLDQTIEWWKNALGSGSLSTVANR